MKAVLFIVAGVALLIGAVLTANGVRHFIRDAVRVSGQVSALPAGGSHPRVTFTTDTNETVSYPQNGWIGGYKVGDRVTVLYQRENPAMTASVATFGALWAWPLALTLLGLGFLLGGLFELGVFRKA